MTALDCFLLLKIINLKFSLRQDLIEYQDHRIFATVILIRHFDQIMALMNFL